MTDATDDDAGEIVAYLQMTMPRLATKLTMERLAMVRTISDGYRRQKALEAALRRLIDQWPPSMEHDMTHVEFAAMRALLAEGGGEGGHRG